MHQIHRRQGFLEMAFSSSPVVAFFKTLNANRYKEITYSKKVVTECFINQCTVGKRMKCTIAVFFAQTDNFLFLNQRFAAGEQKSVNTQFFTFCDNSIHILKRKVHFIAIFRSPTTGTVHIARCCRVHQNNPWNIALVSFRHFQRSLVTTKTRLISGI